MRKAFHVINNRLTKDLFIPIYATMTANRPISAGSLEINPMPLEVYIESNSNLEVYKFLSVVIPIDLEAGDQLEIEINPYTSKCVVIAVIKGEFILWRESQKN